MSAPTRPGSPHGLWWRLILAAPIAWYVFFWVAYLIAEAVCDHGGSGFEVFGVGGTAAIVVGLAVVTTIVTFLEVRQLSRRAVRRDGGIDSPERSDLRAIAVLVTAMFVLSIAFITAAVVVVHSC